MRISDWSSDVCSSDLPAGARTSPAAVAAHGPRRYNGAFPALPSASGHRSMIPRYSRPEMTAIWEPENKFRIWFEIEAHACDAQAELGVIPKAAAKAVWERGAFEVDRKSTRLNSSH